MQHMQRLFYVTNVCFEGKENIKKENGVRLVMSFHLLFEHSWKSIIDLVNLIFKSTLKMFENV